MKYFTLTLALILVLYTSPVNGYQSGLEDPSPTPPTTTPPTPPTTTPPTPPPTTPPTTPTASPSSWEFSSPDDGTENFGAVVFAGIGPLSSIGALSVYSYSNSTLGSVLGSEVQLQVSVLVDTDPGTTWAGPSYEVL